MITINLLKKASSRRGGSGPTRLAGTILKAVLVLVIAVAGAGLVRWWMTQPHTAGKVAAPVAVRSEPGEKPVTAAVPAPAVPAAAAPAPQAVSDKKALPAAIVPAQSVPEKNPAPQVAAALQPVPEKKAVRTAAAVPPPVPEKKAVPETTVKTPERSSPEPVISEVEILRSINDDILFVKNVFQKLIDAAPEGTGFGTLSVDSFTTVTGIGTGGTREQVSALFLNLRRGHLNVLGPPHSFIGDNDGEGYAFVFVCKPSFGEPPAGELKGAGDFVPRSELPGVIKTFLKIAALNKVQLQGGLSRKKTEKTGSFVHSVYRLSCSGTYRNFVAFVLDLVQARTACAFPAVKITARNDAIVDISADVDVITHE
jgi:hypothetical protein